MIVSNAAPRWRLLVGACLLAAVGTLGGCALPTADADGGGASSTQGESEARRRARIRLELAASYLQRGQAQVALEEVQQALAADPGYTDAHHLRGLIFMSLGDLDQAEQSLRRAQSRAPNDADWRRSARIWAESSVKLRSFFSSPALQAFRAALTRSASSGSALFFGNTSLP